MNLRVRFTKSVRWRLTLTVIVVVGLALFGGTLLLAKWVKVTLVGDLRSRNEEVLVRMEDALGQGRLPAELLMSQRDLEQRLPLGHQRHLLRRLQLDLLHQHAGELFHLQVADRGTVRAALYPTELRLRGSRVNERRGL